MRSVIVLVVIAAVGYFLFAVWPTPYTIATKGKDTFRTNRITGAVEVKSGNGWKSLEKSTNVRPSDRYGEETGIKNATK